MNIEDYLNQRAVYWAPAGNGDTGEQLYDDPIEIKCRWEDVHKLFFNEAGEQTVSNARVYLWTEMAGSGEFQPLGVLWLAPDKDLPALDQVPFPGLPLRNPGAAVIRRFDMLPDKDAEEFLRTALL